MLQVREGVFHLALTSPTIPATLLIFVGHDIHTLEGRIRYTDTTTSFTRYDDIGYETNDTVHDRITRLSR